VVFHLLVSIVPVRPEQDTARRQHETFPPAGDSVIPQRGEGPAHLAIAVQPGFEKPYAKGGWSRPKRAQREGWVRYGY
jgi:hypothetical protein